MNSIENKPEKEEDYEKEKCLEEEAETLRKFAFGALCFASISLLTAVFFVPLIFTHARSVQTGIDRESSGCLGKLGQLYGRMERIEPPKGNRRRSARHVPHNTKNKLRQAIKTQRKSRYLQQKLAETAALLNSREVWENGEGKGGIKKSKDDAKNSAELMADNGAEVVEGEKLANDKKGEELFGSSSSFEISSEQQWLSQKTGGGFIVDFTTTFPLPPISRISPRIHSKENGNKSPSPHPTTLASSPFFQSPDQSMPTKNGQPNSDNENGHCGCVYGPPGPPGPTGEPGIDGRDGRPGQNGYPGGDAPNGHKSSIDDFCFNCPLAMAGEPGPRGLKGRPGNAGKAGEKGEPGRRGMAGRRGEAGMRGESGKVGKQGKPGKAGRVTIIPGPEGPEGIPGNPGQPGPPGKPGRPGHSECGHPGPMGEPGIDGRNGAVGVPGNPGAAGKPGPPGGCEHCTVPRTAPGY